MLQLTKPTSIRPPCRELFFAPLVIDLSPNNLEKISCAYSFSKYGHAKQLRDDGRRYFDHPKGAAWIYMHELGGRKVRIIIDLLLHDLSEDAYLLSPYRIAKNFGKAIALDLVALTKVPNNKETTTQYLDRVMGQGPWAILSKLIDRLDNLRSLAGCTPEKQQKQIDETRSYHLPLLIPALCAHGESWAMDANLVKGLIEEAIAPHV